MKDINEISRAEFEELPCRQNWSREILCDCLIILPQKKIHDSGYRCIGFVAVTESELIRIGGCSDVMHIDGIGGLGYNWVEKYGGFPTATPPVAWSIDALAKSGLLRIFASERKIRCGPSLSSFEFWAVPRNEKGDFK